MTDEPTPAPTWASVTIPYTVEAPRPLPGHLAPLDRRHRWRYMKTNAHGDFRYRCLTCRRWKTVTPLVNLIARKEREAKYQMEEYLSETLWKT